MNSRAQSTPPPGTSLTTQTNSIETTELTTSQTHQIILEADIELAVFDRDIAQLNASLYTIMEKRHEVQRRRNIHHAALAPIRRLPLELMSYIFILCLPGPIAPFMQDRRPQSDEAPLLLMRVDRHFRTIALSTSQLWRSLFLDLRAPFPLRPEHTEMVDSWLQRSGDSGASLTIYSSDPFEAAIPPAVDAVISNAHRIQKLNINGSWKFCRALMPIKGSLSLLQDLAIEIWERMPPDPSEPHDLFAVAPALRTLKLNQRYENSFPKFDLPLAQITNCEFVHQTLHQIREFLQQMPNLEKLNVNSCFDTESPPPHTAPGSVVPQFSALANELGMEKFSRPLPNLRSVTFCRGHPRVWPLVKAFLDWGCAPYLESFEIDGLSGVGDRVLTDFLSTTPSLTKLDIRNYSHEPLVLGNLFMSRLTMATGRSQGTPALVPKLQFLSLIGSIDFDGGQLADMIESRLRPRNTDTSSNLGSSEDITLRHLRLQLRREVDERVIRRLEGLRGKGLDLYSDNKGLGLYSDRTF
jgi:hypothetical protein